MDQLRRLARADVHELGQVDLVRAAVVAEGKVEHAEDGRVGHERTGARRAGDEGTGTPGPVTHELGIPSPGRLDVRLQLGRDLIHGLGRARFEMMTQPSSLRIFAMSRVPNPRQPSLLLPAWSLLYLEEGISSAPTGSRPRAVPGLSQALMTAQWRLRQKMLPFRFAVHAALAPTMADWRERARAAEGLGYSALYVTDHFDAQFGPLVALTVAAEATETLHVGTLVLNNDLRNPVVLAKEIASLGLAAEGRIEVGLGAGWLRTDYEESGVGYDAAAVRVERLAESLTVMKSLWSEGETTFEGAHYTVRGARCDPRPETAPRIIVGGWWQAGAHRGGPAGGHRGGEHEPGLGREGR